MGVPAAECGEVQGVPEAEGDILPPPAPPPPSLPAVTSEVLLRRPVPLPDVTSAPFEALLRRLGGPPGDALGAAAAPAADGPPPKAPPLEPSSTCCCSEATANGDAAAMLPPSGMVGAALVPAGLGPEPGTATAPEPAVVAVAVAAGAPSSDPPDPCCRSARCWGGRGGVAAMAPPPDGPPVPSWERLRGGQAEVQKGREIAPGRGAAEVRKMKGGGGDHGRLRAP